MQIRGRIYAKKDSIVEKLLQAKIPFKRGETSILFNLKITAGLLEPGPEYYEIPEVVKSLDEEVVFIVEAAEVGGYRRNLGVAKVVCGLRGRKLTPYYIPRKKNDVSAQFSAIGGLVTVTAYSSEGYFIIMSHKIRENANGFLYIESSCIAHGTKLPEKHIHFEDAVKAAKKKSECINCVCVHFARKKKR